MLKRKQPNLLLKNSVDIYFVKKTKYSCIAIIKIPRQSSDLKFLNFLNKKRPWIAWIFRADFDRVPELSVDQVDLWVDHPRSSGDAPE